MGLPIVHTIETFFQISIQMCASTTVFFFIRDSGCRDVRLPTFCGVGLGEKNGLYVYRPTIVRTQTSFFRSRYTCYRVSRKKKSRQPTLCLRCGTNPTGLLNLRV